MNYSILIDGTVVHTKQLPKLKQTCKDIYDVIEYISEDAYSHLRRNWFHQNEIFPEFYNDWVEAINHYMNSAKKSDYEHSLKIKYLIGGDVYILQFIQRERLKLCF